jgi:elongation factor P
MTTIGSTELKNGTAFLADGKPFKVLKYSLVKMGRGGATVRVTAKNLENGDVLDKTYSSNVKVTGISTQKRKLQYLYNDGNFATFMDPRTFEQVEISQKIIAEELPYIREGQTADILFWDDKPLSIEIPPKVVLKVTDTPPGVKGNSASNVYKSAILENGSTLKVPLFINTGDQIRVDTRTGEYVERAK